MRACRQLTTLCRRDHNGKRTRFEVQKEEKDEQ